MPALLSPSAADRAPDDPLTEKVDDAWRLAMFLADTLPENGVDYVEALALIAQQLADRLKDILDDLSPPLDDRSPAPLDARRRGLRPSARRRPKRPHA
jgi:hypothetical protein